MKRIVILALLLLFLIGCTTQSPPVKSTDETVVQVSTQKSADEEVHLAYLKLRDLSCPSCALGAEAQLRQVDGVITAQVKYPEGTGMIIYDASQISAEEVAEASTIYPAVVISDEQYNP